MTTSVEFGDCIVRSEVDLTGRAPVIVTADDHVLVADAFLEKLIDNPGEYAELQATWPYSSDTLTGRILTLAGRNMRVRYSVGEYRPEEGVHEAHLLDIVNL